MPYDPGSVDIYSNDGTTLLWYSDSGGSVIPYTVTETGVIGAGEYNYEGGLKFLGLATSPRATKPTYTIGTTWTPDSGANETPDDVSLYIVESLEGTSWYVPSGWQAKADYGRFHLRGTFDGRPFLLDNGSNDDTWYNFGIGWFNDGVWYSPETNSIGGYLDTEGSAGHTIISSQSFALYITGGIDVTNPLLISWLQTYGKQLKVTDLTNTTWTVKAGWEAEAGYGEFSIEGFLNDYYNSEESITVLGVGYNVGSDIDAEDRVSVAGGKGSAEFDPTHLLIFTFTGGTDVTNPALIAWLSEYGELQTVDLTNTTWYVPSGWEAEAEYGSFAIDCTIDLGSYGVVTPTQFLIGYRVSEDGKEPYSNRIDGWLSCGGILNLSPAYGFVISITGGRDVRNPKLIAWLSEYGKQIPTDLTGYTVTVPSGWSASAGYGFYSIEGSLDFGHPIAIIPIYQSLNIGYSYGSNDGESWGLLPIANEINIDNNSNLLNDNPLTISITGGDDADAPELIQWLYDNNATFEKTGGEEEPETPTERGEIWYKGVLLATLTEGQTVILHTEGFKAVEGIVIKNVGAVEEEKTYLLTGTWEFKASGLSYIAEDGYGYTEGNPIGFTSNGKTFYRFTTNPSTYTGKAYSSLDYGNLNGSTQTTVQKSNTGWVNTNYKTVAFNGTWNVGERFYKWYIANMECPIKFTIAGITYGADANMTWGEWLESKYNTGEFVARGMNVATSDSKYAVAAVNNVLDSETIMNGYSYTLRSYGCGSWD